MDSQESEDTEEKSVEKTQIFITIPTILLRLMSC